MHAMNLRQLEIFLAVARHGSFTAAAEKLPMAQPAVSLAIHKLEDSLDAKLFVRDKSGATLTDEGKVLVRHAEAVLSQLENARQDIGAFSKLASGHVTLGAPAMVAGYVLPPLLSSFRRQFPGISLSVRQAGAKAIEEEIRSGQIDFGLISDWRNSEDLHAEHTSSHKIVACVAKRSKLAQAKSLSWQQLFEHPLILFPQDYYMRQVVDHASARLHAKVQVAMEVETVPLIVGLAERGVGVATLLDTAAEAHASQVARLALPADARIDVALCRRKHVPLSRAAEALWTHLRGA
jgi:DNA-binding transcriptional LysR family regulator